MPLLYNTNRTPSPLRNETDAGVIATLTRKGWEETTPPTPGAGQEAVWDATARTWSLVDAPAAAPDYEGFQDALLASTGLMAVNRNRMVPTVTLSDPTDLAELRVAVLDLGQANVLAYEWGRFSAVLDHIVLQNGDRDKAGTQTKFQTLLNDWVTAASFGAARRDEIRALLSTHLPTRAYTVPV